MNSEGASTASSEIRSAGEARARNVLRSRSADCCHVKAGELFADADQIGEKLHVGEARGFQHSRPLLGGEEATVGAVRGAEEGGAKCFHEVEDELRVDRLPGPRADALGHDEATAGRKSLPYFSERGVEIVGDVQGVDGVYGGEAGWRHVLFLERTIHVEPPERQELGVWESRLQRALAAAEEVRHQLGESVLTDLS